MSHSTATTTDTTDTEDHPILYRFVQVHSAIKTVQTARYETPDLRQIASLEVINLLRQIDQDIDKSDLFSPNEMIEDVQTTNLKYLLIPFVFGEFLLNCSFGYETRLTQLKEVKLVLNKFIDRLDLLFLVTPEQRKFLNGNVQLDPGSQRTRKIADFQREKALIPKLHEFHEKWAKIVQIESRDQNIGSNLIKNANNSTFAAQIEKTSIENDGETEVDDNERETLLDILSWCVDKVVSLKKSIQEEEKILEYHQQQLEQRRIELEYSGNRSLQGSTSTGSTVSGGSGQNGGTSTTTADKKSSFSMQMSSISENNAISGGGVDLDSSLSSGAGNRPGQYVLSSSQNRDDGNQRVIYNPNPTVSMSGVSTGGLHVHQMRSSEDAKKSVPEHMKNYMVKPKPPQENAKQSQPSSSSGGISGSSQQTVNMMQMQGLGPSAGEIGQRGIDVKSHQTHCPMHPHQIRQREKGINMQDIMTDEERLSKPWFAASAGSSYDCECGDSWQDVTLMPDYVMSNASRGGRGKLVKLCPVHKIGSDVCGCDQSGELVKKDRINDIVSLRTDRTRVFRDRNPYLMEVGDFADMKIAAGELPGIKDRILADKIKADEERHKMRVENGDSDDDETLLTQRERDDREDAEVMKKREWDDWADDHQKGAGNKNYRK